MRFNQLKQEKSAKLHYKMHKVGKKWVTIGMATVGMAVGGAFFTQSNASANEVTPSTTAQQTPKAASSAVADSSAQSQSNSGANSSAQSQGNSGANSSAQSQGNSGANSSAQSQSNSDAHSSAQSQGNSDAHSSAQSQGNSGANSSAQSQSNSDAHSSAQSQSNSDAHSSAQSQSNSGANSSAQSQSNSGANSSAQSQSNSGANSSAQSGGSSIPVDSTTYNYASNAVKATQATSADVHSASAYTSGGSALNSMVVDGRTRIDSIASANPNNAQVLAIAKSASAMQSTTNSLYARQSNDMVNAKSYATNVYSANSIASQMNILVAVAKAKANSAVDTNDQATADSANADVTKGQSLAATAAQTAITGQSNVDSLAVDTRNIFQQLTSYNVSPLYQQATSLVGMNTSNASNGSTVQSNVNNPQQGTGDFYVSTAVTAAKGTDSQAQVAASAYNGLTFAASQVNAISNAPQSVLDDVRNTTQQGYNAAMNAQSQGSVADMSVQVANNANNLAKTNATKGDNNAALSDVSIAASAAATASSAYIQATNQASLALSAQSHVQQQQSALMSIPSSNVNSGNNNGNSSANSLSGLIDPMNFSTASNGVGNSAVSDTASADSAMISAMGSATNEANFDFTQAQSVASKHVNNKNIQSNYQQAQSLVSKITSASNDAQAIYGRLDSARANEKQQQAVASEGYQRAQSASAVEASALQKGDKQTAAQAASLAVSYINAAHNAQTLAQKQSDLINASRARINSDGQVIADSKKLLTQAVVNIKNERYAVTGGHQKYLRKYIKFNRGVQVTTSDGQTAWVSPKSKAVMKLIGSRRLANGQIQDTALYHGARVTFIGRANDIDDAYYQNNAFANRSSFYVRVNNQKILEHTSANFNSRHVKAYVPGKVLHVVGLTHYHGITRFVLANGHFITANKYLVSQL